MVWLKRENGTWNPCEYIKTNSKENKTNVDTLKSTFVFGCLSFLWLELDC